MDLYFAGVTDGSNLITPGNPAGSKRSIALTAGQLTTVTATYHGITTQPANRTVTAFNNTTFIVGVAGTPTGFLWKRGTTTVSTSETCPLNNVTSAVAGNYKVTVTWDNGTKTSNSATLTVQPAAQTINFGALPDRVLADGAFDLVATASSGLAVSHAIVSGPASLSGGKHVTPGGLGSVTIRATQSGSADHAAAVPVDRSFQIIGDSIDTWLVRHFTPEELQNPLISGPMADPGRDEVNVLLAFALNLDPKANDRVSMIPGTGTRGLPVAAMENIGGEPRMVMEYVRRRAEGAPGITYRIEFTSDLNDPAGWEATGSEVATAIDGTWERVKVTDSLPAIPARFARLAVALQ